MNYANTLLDSLKTLDFELPSGLEATAPPEARGLDRDEVRLMVSVPGMEVEHATFRDLPDYLRPGDVLAVNTSPTMKAALPAATRDDSRLELRLSTRLPAGLWTVELRRLTARGSEPLLEAESGEEVALAGGAKATLLTPYARIPEGVRLWVARVETPLPLEEYLEANGSPIRYGYVDEEWPASYYQTVFATGSGFAGSGFAGSGSAEIPSAGRPFTSDVISSLVTRGVRVAPLVLHTGVSSPEGNEPPYEERYRVSKATADLINFSRGAGGRVVAVGTTVVRALETVSDGGTVHPGEGYTDVVITPERGVGAVDALITGLHEPRSSHLAMLEAIAGRERLERAYDEALKEGYLWHEFGDSHLILRR